MSYKNVRRAAVAALSVTAAAGIVAGAVLPAAASSGAPSSGSVRYLSTSQVPQSDRYGDWVRTAVKPGVPSPQYFCIKNALPAGSTAHRHYRSDSDAEMRQFVTTLSSSSAALQVAAKVRDSIESCAKRFAAAYPQEKVSAGRFGSHSVEDGLTVYGVFFSPPGSEPHAQLYGVGRDGRDVTVVTMGQVGVARDAPVSAFTGASKTALQQLR